jgi:hypothetical protein
VILVPSRGDAERVIVAAEHEPSMMKVNDPVQVEPPPIVTE